MALTPTVIKIFDHYRNTDNVCTFVNDMLQTICIVVPFEQSSEHYREFYNECMELSLTKEEHVDAWIYIIDMLNDKLLSPFCYVNDILTEYIEFGKSVITKMSIENLLWFLPVYLSIDMLKTDTYAIKELNDLFYNLLPPVYKSLSTISEQTTMNIFIQYLESQEFKYYNLNAVPELPELCYNERIN